MSLWWYYDDIWCLCVFWCVSNTTKKDQIDEKHPLNQVLDLFIWASAWADCKGIWDNMWWNPQPKHEMDRSTWGLLTRPMLVDHIVSPRCGPPHWRIILQEWFRFCASKLKLTYCTARMTIGLPSFANRFSHIFLRWFTFLSCVSAEVAMRWSVSTRATSFWRSGLMAVLVKNPMIPWYVDRKWSETVDRG